MEHKSDGFQFGEASGVSRKPVKLIWHQSFVRIQGEDHSQVDIPYSVGEFELGGNRDGLLFVKSRLATKESYYVDFDKALSDGLKKISVNSPQLLTLLQKRKRVRHFDFAVLGVVCLMLFLLIYYRGPVFGSMTYLMPFKWEKAIGDKIFLRNQLPKNEQDAASDLKTVAASLFPENDNWKQQLTFHISPKREMNAYATIGGHVFVHRGLILDLKKPEELLGVVAHEIEHVRQRHVVRSLAQAIGLFGIIQAILGDVTGLVAVLVDQGGPLLQLSYSRELENEADDSAIEMMARAKIDPAGLPNALEKIWEEQKRLLSQVPGGEVLEKAQKFDLWSTHPEMQERIANLRKKIADRNFGKTDWRDLSSEWMQLQRKVKEL